MRISRQQERRARFQFALSKMPVWETWTTKDHSVPERAIAINTYHPDGSVVKTVEVEPPRIRHHCKAIGRRTRRDMARKLSLREFRADHGLLEQRLPMGDKWKGDNED